MHRLTPAILVVLALCLSACGSARPAWLTDVLAGLADGGAAASSIVVALDAHDDFEGCVAAHVAEAVLPVIADEIDEPGGACRQIDGDVTPCAETYGASAVEQLGNPSSRAAFTRGVGLGVSALARLPAALVREEEESGWVEAVEQALASAIPSAVDAAASGGGPFHATFAAPSVTCEEDGT